MADRVLIFASDPGRVRFQLAVQLPRPRNPESVEVRQLIDEVYALMTAGSASAPAAPPKSPSVLQLAERLPEADIGRMEGLLELLAGEQFRRPRRPAAAWPRRPSSPTTSCCRWRRPCHCSASPGWREGDLHLTPLGRQYVEGEHTLRQELFGQPAARPGAARGAHPPQPGAGRIGRAAPRSRSCAFSARRLDATEAERVLRTAIEWGRHGEVFEYNYTTGLIHLPEGEVAAEPAA